MENHERWEAAKARVIILATGILPLTVEQQDAVVGQASSGFKSGALREFWAMVYFANNEDAYELIGHYAAPGQRWWPENKKTYELFVARAMALSFLPDGEAKVKAWLQEITIRRESYDPELWSERNKGYGLAAMWKVLQIGILRDVSWAEDKTAEILTSKRPIFPDKDARLLFEQNMLCPAVKNILTKIAATIGTLPEGNNFATDGGATIIRSLTHTSFSLLGTREQIQLISGLSPGSEPTE